MRVLIEKSKEAILCAAGMSIVVALVLSQIFTNTSFFMMLWKSFKGFSALFLSVVAIAFISGNLKD